MAGEINWGLLNTNLPAQVASSFADGQQRVKQNQLADIQLQGAQRSNRLADLAMQDEQATRDAYRNSGGDMSKTVAALQQGGLHKPALELQSKMSAQQKEALAAQKAQLETHLKQFEVVGQIMSGVTDQATYDQARQQIAQVVGPEAAAKSPAIYDPAVIERGRTQAMSVKDQMAQKWKELDAQLSERKFGYQQEHDAAVDKRIVSENEKNRSVQVRGQNLVDARARETMAAGKVPSGYRALPDGSLEAITGGPGDPKTKINAKPPTEFQGKSAVFGARAEEADKLLSGLESSGQYSRTGALAGGGGGISSTLLNPMLSKDTQKVVQAQRDFVNAVLRQESGAAISQGEFDNARRQYFPQPGDSADVVKQKSANRKLAVQGFMNNAGPAQFHAPAAAGGWSITKE